MNPLPPNAGLAPDTKVVLLALCVAALTSAGNFFQKLNGVAGGSAILSVWLLLSIACFCRPS